MSWLQKDAEHVSDSSLGEQEENDLIKEVGPNFTLSLVFTDLQELILDDAFVTFFSQDLSVPYTF